MDVAQYASILCVLEYRWFRELCQSPNSDRQAKTARERLFAPIPWEAQCYYHHARSLFLGHWRSERSRARIGWNLALLSGFHRIPCAGRQRCLLQTCLFPRIPSVLFAVRIVGG